MAKWIVKEQNEADIAQIRSDFGFSDVVARILYNRGLRSKDAINDFFDTDIKRLHDPYLLLDMDKATDRIKSAVDKHEKITIYGDYDVDGITSVVVLYKYLKSLGADVDYYIPDRAEEGYGLNINALNTIKDSGTRLIITVDTGTTALSEISLAVSMGIDVVVTDHHECKPEIPECTAVINPKRNDSVYPFKELAGVGVVFKLICALTGDDELAFDLYGDLVSIGTIADIMPLIDENRILVTNGLELLRKRPSCGIKALLEAAGSYNKNNVINAGTVAFQIAPRINAAGRIGDPKQSVLLLLSEKYAEAQEYARILCEENHVRRQKESEIIADVEKILQNRNPDDKIIVVGSENWHHGVIGIVASKIVERFNLPCILVCFDGENAKGSARSIKNVSMFELLTMSSEYLEKFGGHEMAAGLTLSKGRFNDFVKDITEKANKVITDDMLIPVVEPECKISIDEVCLETVSELKRLEPFGTGNPTPQFMLSDVTITDFIGVGDGAHLKLTLSHNGRSLTAMLFGLGPTDFDFAVGDTVDICFSLAENFFNNKVSLSVNVKNIRLSAETEEQIRLSADKYNKFKQTGVIDDVSVSKNEFTSVYRYLYRHYVNSSQCSYKPHALARTLKSRGLEKFDYCKLMLCLDTLSELGILSYTNKDNLIIHFLDVENKKNLSDSKVWNMVGGEK